MKRLRHPSAPRATLGPPAARPWLPVAVLALVVALFTTAGCPQPSDTRTSSLAGPADVTAVCVIPVFGDNREWNLTPDPTCSANGSRLWGIATNSDNGELALLNLRPTSSERNNLDSDPFIPGFTRIPLGGTLSRIVAGPGERFVYILDAGSPPNTSPALVRFDLTDWDDGTLRQPLPGAALDLLYVDQETAGAFGGAGIVVTIPTQDALFFVPIDGEDFGGRAADELAQISTSLSPAEMALVAAESGAPGVVYVADTKEPKLSIVELNSGAEVKLLGLAPECQDGLDNDSDGLTDSADTDCLDDEGNSEASAGLSTACNDGQDNDGDGQADYPDDPGCASALDDTEWSDNIQCADGFDNDGDGAVDGADTNCQSNSTAEQTSACTSGSSDATGLYACVSNQPRPACDDGEDNDGDGLIDANDPDCYSRAYGVEARVPQLAISDVAATPDGRFVYATHRARGEVLVIDTATREVIPVHERPAPLGDPLFDHLGALGVVMSDTPLQLTFAPSLVSLVDAEGSALADDDESTDADTDDNGLDDALSAFVAFATGEIQLINTTVFANADGATEAGADYHLLGGTVGSDTQTTEPDLFANGREITQVGAPAEGYPHFGPFDVSDADETGIYNGITVEQGNRQLRSQTWNFVYRGVLPDSERNTGRVVARTVRTDADGEVQAISIFHDPYADFCAIGVEVGDTLEIRPDFRMSCPEQDDPESVTRGNRLEYRILEVTPDTLTLAAGNFDGHCTPTIESLRLGEDIAALLAGADDEPVEIIPLVTGVQTGVGFEVYTAEERLELQLDDEDLGEVCRPVPLPSPRCFPGSLKYAIRVPARTYMVAGTLAGHLHRWERQGGRCVERTGDSRIRGRAIESTPVPADEWASAAEACGVSEGPLEDCGAYPLCDGYFELPEDDFDTFGFTAKLRPGCIRSGSFADGSDRAAQFVQTGRDTLLRFRLVSAFFPRTLSIGTVPIQLRYLNKDERLYSIDPGRNTIEVIDPKNDSANDVPETFF